jgi:hypothetical protein
MNYVLAQNGQVQQYPYTLDDLRLAHPDVSFPREPSNELWAE